MKYIYRIYQIIIALPVSLVATLLTALTTLLGSWLGCSRIFGYYPGKIWSQLICFIFLLPVKVEGRGQLNKNTSYVFVANHQGLFDIFLIYGFLGHNFRWLMKDSIRTIPFVGWACEASGHIFVNRTNIQSIQESIARAQEALKHGKSMVVFPEGTRSLTGKMGRFKKGAFLLADELQLPVVPITISGSFNVLPKNEKFIKRHRLTLVVHPPIYPQGKGEGNVTALLNESFKKIESELPASCRKD